MNGKTLQRLLCLLLLTASSLWAVEISNPEGTVIDVDILDIEPSRIHIRMANGKKLWLERTRLSAESEKMIAAQELSEQEAYKEMNELLGIPLFADGKLWDDAPEAVADRLGWPEESQTQNQSSYRKYPPADYRILGSRPYSAVLYGDQAEPQMLSIVFANKGDFPFSDPPKDDEIDQMKQAIDADVERIETLLTKELGEADLQQFGSGRGIKQLTKRWDWKGHAFLLASQDGEFVALKIITSDSADNKGRNEKLSDAKLRELSKQNIETRENGDVIISNIPMVNQGPKGYCVPATFERYLRYMQIPADMYILAMAGQTKAGGGTSLPQIIESIDSYVSSQSRSMKQVDTDIKLRTIQKYIDRGQPMIWVMFSSPEYNHFVNERTVQRQQTTDWNAWADKTKSEARAVELRKDFESAHACMIVGYNKATGEIAVSDSWGPSYRERWAPVEQIEQVSQGSIYLIDY